MQILTTIESTKTVTPASQNFVGRFMLIPRLMVMSLFLILLPENAQAQVVACFITILVACFITIQKVANPADNTVFNFTRSGDFTSEFTLMDPGNSSEVITVLGGNPVTVTEQVPPGWMLDPIECQSNGVDVSDVTNGRLFNCLTIGGSGTCTFTNRKNTPEIPTFSQWGLLIMAITLGIAGFVLSGRRQPE